SGMASSTTRYSFSAPRTFISRNIFRALASRIGKTPTDCSSSGSSTTTCDETGTVAVMANMINTIWFRNFKILQFLNYYSDCIYDGVQAWHLHSQVWEQK